MEQISRAKSELLTAALSAVIGIKLVTRSSASVEPEKISLFDHHKTTYSYGPVGDTRDEVASSDHYSIIIKTLNDQQFNCDVKRNGKVRDMKHRIYELKGIQPNQQRLLSSGKQLEDDSKLDEYSIGDRSMVYLVASLNETAPVILDPSTLDAIHDFDFRNINDDNRSERRGGEPYFRPCGYQRFALNVTGKFENMLWLGCDGNKDEWPVSYHATGQCDDQTLAQNGRQVSRGKEFNFGSGVYSTPDVKLAEKYAVRFRHDSSDYLIIFQNRVNPKTLVKLIDSQDVNRTYWVNPRVEDVRPYGICIKKVTK